MKRYLISIVIFTLGFGLGWLSKNGVVSSNIAPRSITDSSEAQQPINSHDTGWDVWNESTADPSVTKSSLSIPPIIATLEQLTGKGGHKDRRAVETQFSHLWGAEAIALQRIGNQYLVDIHLNRVDQANLLIDTGASTTVLSRTSFNQLTTKKRARILGKRIFQTANGFTEGSLYTVPQLQLGSHRVENAQVAVLDFTMTPGVDGLLGMNILAQFRFHIEQESVRLLLGR